MQNKYLRFFHVIFCVCIVFFLFVVPGHSKSLKLYDTDLVYSKPRLKNNVLRVAFSYINRDEDSSISWKNLSVDCNCEVYSIDRDYNKLTQKPIASGRKFLVSSKESIFIDIPGSFKKEYDRGIVECSMQIGWKNLKTEEKFWTY